MYIFLLTAFPNFVTFSFKIGQGVFPLTYFARCEPFHASEAYAGQTVTNP